MTLNGRRFIEYLAPACALWIASLWACIDTGRLNAMMRDLVRSWPRALRWITAPLVALLFIALVAHHATGAWASLRRAGTKPFDAWRMTMMEISKRAKPNDRVFHSSWDEFPLLFAADDRLRYVSGLDPVFLHDENPSLSIAVRDLTLGPFGSAPLHSGTTSTLWDVIVEQTNSRFVFVTTKRHPAFDATLRQDPRFMEIARDEDTAGYAVVGDGR